MASGGPPPWRETALAAAPAGLVVVFLLLGGWLTAFGFVGALVVGLLGAGLVALARAREFHALRVWLEGLAGGERLLPPDAAGPLAGAELVRPVLGLVREQRRLRRLNASHERTLATLIETLPDPVLLVDAGETVLQANEAARRGFGVTDGGLPLGRFLRDPGLLAAVRAALEGEEASQLAFSPPTDRLKQFAARVAPTLLADGGRGALVLLREETEQVMIERMRSDFVANASHEIRTPLASLMGFIETLRGPARNDAPARESFLALMAEETARLNRLVGDLLSLSRIELAAIAPPEGRCEVEAVVEAVLARLRPVAEAAGVDLCHAPTDGLPDAAADADQIHQLLLNLVDNAIKYGGREVVVATDVVAAGAGRFGTACRAPGPLPCRERQWPRHPARAPAPPHRALLPRRQAPLAPEGRHRARPCHRQAHRPPPPGTPRHHEHARGRKPVCGVPAVGAGVDEARSAIPVTELSPNAHKRRNGHRHRSAHHPPCDGGNPSMNRFLLSAAAVALLASAGSAAARDQIRIVGSSTVYPFSTTVAEQFGNKTEFPAPIVESTGTGGGMKLFCQGVGDGTPDITNASRRIKSSEAEMCAENGVKDITEVKIGFDGIVIANSKKAELDDLTQKQIFLALAKEVPQDGKMVANPYKTWSEIDPSLPDKKIEVLGPPPTSGTRDAFVELVMDKGCEEVPEIAALEDDAKKAACQTVREDGGYVEAGENDNLIVQKLEANKDAFGIFGYSYLEQNQDMIQGSKIAGVAPEFDSIASGDYPVSRPLFIYVKNAHADVIPGIKEFMAEFTSDAAMGEYGYLADKGLIPLPENEAEEVRQTATNMTPMDASAL